MSLARDRLPSADERRAPEAAPAPPRIDGPLTPVVLHALQRSGGNRATHALIQRLRDRTDLGPDIVEFEDADALPTAMGNLDSDKANKYVKQAKDGERVYKKVPKGAFQFKKPDPLVTAQKENQKLKEKLAVAEKTLFGVNDNGGTEGTFEYVANYLFGEVFDVDRVAAQEIWDVVWSVGQTVSGTPQRVRNDIADQSALLQRMIDVGLDASWKKVPVTELVQIKATSGQKPASSMPIAVRKIADYFSALFHRAPGPKTAGVGFHTTDGAPSAVAKSKAEGGWGGVTRPITVEFFKKRYALAKPWNPLGGWLEKHGETFRKGIKDNELLSTVSVATAIHGSVRFPLADIKRKGKRVVKNGANTFEMEAYTYAVAVREGFATFARQEGNAFGEIATGDIPIEDIIGWSKVTRWHKYQDTAETVPSTADFWYEMTALERNPEFPRGGIYDRMFASARAEIEGERKLTTALYKP